MKYEIPNHEGFKGWFKKRFENTLNSGYSITFICVGRRTGVGKTFGTLRLAEMLDPKGFTRKEVEQGKYTFYAHDFINALQNIEKYRWVLFDESGRKDSGGAKVEWQSDANRALSSTMQVSRFKKPVSAFIVPHRSFIASQLQGLAQLLIVFGNRGYAKCYDIQPSEFDGNIYLKYAGDIRLTMPDRDLIDAVEGLKKKMFSEDTMKWVKDIQRSKLLNRSSEDIVEEILKSNKVNQYREIIVSPSGIEKVKWDIPKIQMEFKCSRSKAYEIQNMLKIEQ